MFVQLWGRHWLDRIGRAAWLASVQAALMVRTSKSCQSLGMLMSQKQAQNERRRISSLGIRFCLQRQLISLGFLYSCDAVV